MKYLSLKLDWTTFPLALDIFPTIVSPTNGVRVRFSNLNVLVAGSQPSFLTILPLAPPLPNVTSSPLIKFRCSNCTLNVGRSSFLIILPALFIGSKKPPVLPIPVREYSILESVIFLAVIVNVLKSYMLELYPATWLSGYVLESVLGTGSGNVSSLSTITGWPWILTFSTNIWSPTLNGKLVPNLWASGLQPPRGLLSVMNCVTPFDVAVTTPTPLLLLIGIILGGFGNKSNPVKLSFNILTDPIPVPSRLTSVFELGLIGKNKSGAVL